MNKNKCVNHLISSIIFEYNVDLMILAEYDDDVKELQHDLGGEYIEGLTAGCERITIICRNKEIEPAFQNKYCSIQIIDKEYIIACVHLPSKLCADENKRGIAITRIVEEIEKCEIKLQLEKTILVGDMNENPYENGCLSAGRFHAIPSFKDAHKLVRTILDEKFKMFYNPMWNLFGDFSFPPGTYYYAGNEVITPYWNMYDQVMIRPCLREFFVDQELKIIYQIGDKKLIDNKDHPLKSISDHLPLIFELKEEER